MPRENGGIRTNSLDTYWETWQKATISHQVILKVGEINKGGD
jgi:hypothetical protein